MNGKKSFRSLILLITLVALTACGSGSGSGGGTTSLPTGTFFKTYHIGDNGYNAYPFSDSQDAKIQLLYTAAEINGSGNLTALRFRRDSDASQVNCPNTTIRLGHTNLTALTATFGNNVERGQGSLVTVLDNAAVNIPAGSAGEWFEVSLPTPFAYNGVDNLIVEMEQFAVCSARVRMDVSFPVTDRVVSSSAIDNTPGVAEHNQTTGTVTSTLYWMQFVFTGGDNKMNYAAVSAGTVPFVNTPNNRHGQMLHQADSINGSGPITGIAMISNVVSTAQTYTANIKLGHTTLSVLTDTFADNFDSGNPTEVATALTFTIPAGIPAGSPIWIPLSGSFNYNGIDNLIVDIEVTAATGTTSWARGGVIGYRLYAAVGDTMGTLTYGPSLTVFRFNGGPMNVITDGSSISFIPFGGGVETVYQTLYNSAALGTGGEITSLRFRLANDSNAFDYTDVNLVLGHTTLSSLGAGSFVANIESDRTAAFSGTISIPDGVVNGDWITVPLSTSFTYDPTKNLVVQWDKPVSSTFGNSVRAHTAGTGRYVNHIQGNSGNRTSDASNITIDSILDLSLTVSK